ncbi:achaete-scute homolog 5 [Protopterus annectens]|uniref:achaete-scute homolog 5 n=1 Tax=Protopterus annectens TaxID=7888 RepID=UPI001CFB6BD2|nr:achaete-scute homolog 5 [Protopterus annectens]
MNNNYSRALSKRRTIVSPSCMQFGVPAHHGPSHFTPRDAFAHLPFLFYPANIDPTYYDAYSRIVSYMPFHGHFGVYDCPFEPVFIQKRNERERIRVKCVNEGYARLRDHLPGAMSEKRLSKAETLKAAIKYIKYLQDLLSRVPEEVKQSEESAASPDYLVASKQESISNEESKMSSKSSSSLYCKTEGI